MGTKKHSRSVFIFRRDLRLQDNVGLMRALKESKEVVAAFVFDPRQVGRNPFRSENAVQFMLESLMDLDNELREMGGQLCCWEGKVEEVLDHLIVEAELEGVYYNRDYTPFSQKRDTAINKLCRKRGVAVHSFDDALLSAPGTVLKGDGTPYKVYTPFYKAASRLEVTKPQRNRASNYFTQPLKGAFAPSDYEWKAPENEQLFVRGGRTVAKKLVRRISQLQNYKESRDYPAQSGTTGLSAHHKFGTVSVREVYHYVINKFGKNHTLIRELYWRDFFTHIAFHFPHVFSGCFYSKYDGMRWENDRRKFKTWCVGKTGYPIVDAGMRELNVTGYMHNRVRMIVASFLIKDLHIDWRWGEKYFAQKLIDYDPAVNNGNWQWAASTGCDAQPYFRIFNPWRQQERFDPDGLYIKKWVPELSNCTAKELSKLAGGLEVEGYPQPIVDHSEEKEVAEDRYLEVQNG